MTTEQPKIDLMIIGAQKAGTTSLDNYLNEHPEVLGHSSVEFAYFQDEALYKGGFEAEFKKHFTKGNTINPKRYVAKNAVMSYSEIGLQRLAQHNSACKLIFLIREPVARAYSSYTMEIFNGWLNRDFSELKTILDNNNKQDVMYRLFIELGEYVNHLKLVYKYFPKEQVRIVLFEDLKNNPLPICQSIYEWLDIDKNFVPKLETVHNVTVASKSKFFASVISKLRNNNNPIKRVAKFIMPYRLFSAIGNFMINSNKSNKKADKISPEMKAYLSNYFKPFNEELEQLAGIQLNKNWKYLD